MKVFIELYASLMHLLPPGQGRFRRDMQVEPSTTVQQMIDRFSIDDEQAHIVLVNGHFVCGDARKEHVLNEGDTVSIWPPVAGG